MNATVVDVAAEAPLALPEDADENDARSFLHEALQDKTLGA